MVHIAPVQPARSRSYTCLFSFLIGKANCLTAKPREASYNPVMRCEGKPEAPCTPSFFFLPLLLFVFLLISLLLSLSSFLLGLHSLLCIFYLSLPFSLPPQFLAISFPHLFFAEKQKAHEGDELHSLYCFSASCTK